MRALVWMLAVSEREDSAQAPELHAVTVAVPGLFYDSLPLLTTQGGIQGERSPKPGKRWLIADVSTIAPPGHS